MKVIIILTQWECFAYSPQVQLIMVPIKLNLPINSKLLNMVEYNIIIKFYPGPLMIVLQRSNVATLMDQFSYKLLAFKICRTGCILNFIDNASLVIWCRLKSFLTLAAKRRQRIVWRFLSVCPSEPSLCALVRVV